MGTTDLSQWTVMISSTMRDLTQERKAVAQVVTEMGMIPWMAERPPFVGMTPEQLCKTMATDCQLFILILGPSYGYCPDGTQPSAVQRSVTSQEYEWAKANNANKVLVVARADVERTHDQRQRQFINEVLNFRSGYVRPPFFRTLDELREQVRTQLLVWKAQQSEGISGYLRAVLNHFGRLNGALVSLTASDSLSLLLKQRPAADDTETEEVVDTARNLLTYLRRFALVEGGGGGKTMLLQQFAADLAGAALVAASLETTLIPLYIRSEHISNLTEVAPTLHPVPLQAIVSRGALRAIGQDIPNAQVDLAEALTQGRAVILLDGVDELAGTEAYIHFMQAMQPLFEANRTIVAMRPEVGSVVAGWPAFGIQRLHRYQRQALIERVLANSQKKGGALVDAAPLIAYIEGHENIRAWASNPLFLTLIAQEYAEQNALPSEAEHNHS